MEKLTLTKDQFAVFVADIIKEIKMYNYDAFYDIVRFAELMKKENAKKQIRWYVRSTGTWTAEPDDKEWNDNVKRAFDHKKVLLLTFNIDEVEIVKEKWEEL